MTTPPGPSWGGFLKGVNALAAPDKKPTKKKPPTSIVIKPGSYPDKTAKTGPPSTNVALDKLLKKYTQWRKYLPGIKIAAHEFGVDPVDMLKVLITENEPANKTAVSDKGAVGLAQIWDKTVRKELNPSQYAQLVREVGTNTRNFADNDTASFKYLAWRMAGTIRDFGGDVDAWYRSNYNPGGPASRTPNVIAKRAGIIRYQPGYSPTPNEKAGKNKSDHDAAAVLADPYVAGLARTKGGKGGELTLTSNPAKAITYDGAPVTRSNFLTLKRQLSDYYVSYTGKRPSNSQIQQYISKGWSTYTLSNLLSQTPSFHNSPVYKQNAPALKGLAHTLLGEKEKTPPKELIRQAIVNQWSQATFEQVLRKRDNYINSSEFKGKTATMGNIYQSIMGTPGPNATNAIKQAVAGGWSPDQFAAWIRSRDSYAYSPEYQTKSMNFLSSLGLITGDQTVLRPNKNAPEVPTQPGGGAKLPADKRLGKPKPIANPSNLVATLSA